MFFHLLYTAHCILKEFLRSIEHESPIIKSVIVPRRIIGLSKSYMAVNKQNVPPTIILFVPRTNVKRNQINKNALKEKSFARMTCDGLAILFCLRPTMDEI